MLYGVCFCKQKTAYEMRMSDWSSDVCSSDRAVRTPARAPLLIASQALAVAIAAEWAAQGETIDPAAMPLTGLANAAIDLAAPDPAAFAEPIAAYAASHLVCYRDDRNTALQADRTRHVQGTSVTVRVNIGGRP